MPVGTVVEDSNAAVDPPYTSINQYLLVKIYISVVRGVYKINFGSNFLHRPSVDRDLCKSCFFYGAEISLLYKAFNFDVMYVTIDLDCKMLNHQKVENYTDIQAIIRS